MYYWRFHSFGRLCGILYTHTIIGLPREPYTHVCMYYVYVRVYTTRGWEPYTVIIIIRLDPMCISVCVCIVCIVWYRYINIYINPSATVIIIVSVYNTIHKIYYLYSHTKYVYNIYIGDLPYKRVKILYRVRYR